MFPAGDTDKSLVPVTLAICIPTHSHVSPFLTPHLEAYFVLTPRGFSTLFATQRGTASHLMHPPHTSTAASPVCRRAFASSGFWDQQVGWPQRLEVSFLQEQPSFWTSTPFFFLFFYSDFMHWDELCESFPCGSCCPPCCFCEMQAPNADVFYFHVMQFCYLFLYDVFLFSFLCWFSLFSIPCHYFSLSLP